MKNQENVTAEDVLNSVMRDTDFAMIISQNGEFVALYIPESNTKLPIPQEIINIADKIWGEEVKASVESMSETRH